MFFLCVFRHEHFLVSLRPEQHGAVILYRNVQAQIPEVPVPAPRTIQAPVPPPRKRPVVKKREALVSETAPAPPPRLEWHTPESTTTTETEHDDKSTK